MAESLLDVATAVAVGGRFAGDGPTLAHDEAAAVVEELRADANRSTGLVREFTGLVAQERTAPVLVVDRKAWIKSNAQMFSDMLAPMADKIRSGGVKLGPGAFGPKVAGFEVGLVLGFLSSKILGQFDPFHQPHGRLMLVAPNVVQIEQQLHVNPTDFRLWVCLHEETHRVQFTAVPWMADHLKSLMAQMFDSFEPTTFAQNLSKVAESVRAGGGSANLMEQLRTPEQRAVMDQVTGVMSLLEGHADVVMDGVGPEVIPTVREIRAAFNDRRRSGSGGLDRWLRKVLGMEAKLAQYRDGAKFVNAVVDQAGMAQFNAVWEKAENLPSKAEIADPKLWQQRVLG